LQAILSGLYKDSAVAAKALAASKAAAVAAIAAAGMQARER